MAPLSSESNHLLAPPAIPIVAGLDNCSEEADSDSLVAALVVSEEALDVSMTTDPLLPDKVSLCVVDAVTVAGEEYVDPGTVGFVSRILKSDSCQRTWIAKTKSVGSVATHLLYDDDVSVRHE